MFVNQILANKATDGVLTIKASATIAEAAQMLSDKRIGSLVVSDDGKTASGILSERDIVRELGQRGAGCMSQTVADLMTRDVVTCDPTDSAEHALEKMTEGRFRHMPVVKDAELLGLITLGDVVKARLMEVDREKQALEGMIMGF